MHLKNFDSMTVVRVNKVLFKQQDFGFNQHKVTSGALYA